MYSYTKHVDNSLLKDKMIVCRFSRTGFEPQFQDHLENSVKYLLQQDFSQMPSHLVPYLKEAVKEVNPDWKSHLVGFWVFLGCQKDQDSEQVRHQLNHLKNTEGFKWFERVLHENTLCYPSHSVLRGKPKTLKEFSKGDAVYVIAAPD